MTGPIQTVHIDGFDAAFWLLKGMVCSNLPCEEVERHLRQYPPGTRHGWQIEGEPVPCPDKAGYEHYIVVC